MLFLYTDTIILILFHFLFFFFILTMLLHNTGQLNVCMNKIQYLNGENGEKKNIHMLLTSKWSFQQILFAIMRFIVGEQQKRNQRTFIYFLWWYDIYFDLMSFSVARILTTLTTMCVYTLHELLTMIELSNFLRLRR